MSEFEPNGNLITYVGEASLVFHRDYEVMIFESFTELEPFCDGQGLCVKSAVREAIPDFLEVLIFCLMGGCGSVLTELDLEWFGGLTPRREYVKAVQQQILRDYSLEVAFEGNTISFLAVVHVSGDETIQHITVRLPDFKVTNAVLASHRKLLL